jgi:preprotein translocase subunit SecG
MQKEVLQILQIIVSLILISLILLQKRGSALSSQENYFTRRGIEKYVFNLTIFVAVLFILLSVLNLYF